ncbi:hypothetical protein VTL71DRAFT_6680 [Oculimacula yallundae]|uniref:Pre-mRNA-splicing factor ISY1 n=1 Tax=Oculimacula yallundae TaxID=86028 RepID=A0ABR4BXL1_9HELO
MARNSEKAQSMLFRFRESQAADLGILDAGRTRRPKMITEVTSIPSCEKWRGQVLKEISRKVSKIQETTLSDFMIRDLNDEINKLMREKHMWEVQVRNLGGPNYMRGGGKVYDDEGVEIRGAGKGYRYFGRAKTLPGVAELFEASKPSKSTNTTHPDLHLRKLVDASYYGYNLDEEDGTLLAYESQKEQEAFENLLAEGGGTGSGGRGREGEEWQPLPGDEGNGEGWKVPGPEEVQEELVERRRRRLLDKLGS